MAKILVVDDEEDLRELITDELSDVGHTAVDFSGGQAALDYLAKEPVDLILSDITMPQMTGYQFFRAVKEQFPEYANTPFIFMTALSDRANEVKGLRLGVDDYITKPIDYDLLLLRVEGHLRRRQAAPPPATPPAARQETLPPTPPADQPQSETAEQADFEPQAPNESRIEVSEKEIELRNEQLDQLYSFENLHALPLLVASGSPSKIKALSFSTSVMDQIRRLSSIGRYDSGLFLGLQRKMLDRLKEMPNSSKVFARCAMLLPMPFGLLHHAETRETMISLCQDLEESMDLIIIVEVIDAPDPLKAYEDSLKPLPIGKKLQFIELRHPEQADGLALDKIGAAYVSMRFSDLEACSSDDLSAFQESLERRGAKLYVKDIPEGKLLDAQNFSGKLYSLMK